MAIGYSRQICNNFDTYISQPRSKLVTSDDYALTEEGKRALERISVSLQEYNDNTVTQKV